MVDEISTENSSYETAKNLLQSQHHDKLRALKDKLQNELQTTIETNARSKEDMERAYNVELSRNREGFDEKLSEIRMSMSKQLEAEKVNGESEVEKTRTRYREQIAKYKDNGEKTLADLHRKYEQAADNVNKKIEKERGRA